MLAEDMVKMLNEQLRREFESSYLYLGMAAWFNDQAFSGFSQWMQEQAKEEVEHAMKIYRYIEERGNKVVLAPIAAPASSWDSVQEAIEMSLKHEQGVTAAINRLMDAAVKEKDHGTAIFLQWFVTEQIEEEATFRTVLDKIKMIKPSCSALMFMDKSMAKRAES